MKVFLLFNMLVLVTACGGGAGGGDAGGAGVETAEVIFANNNAPTSASITPADFNQDTENLITLAYTDAESDIATACSISNPSNVSETTPCSCDTSGVCTVGITGTTSYSGAASFDYTVTAGGKESDTSSATLNILNNLCGIGLYFDGSSCTNVGVGFYSPDLDSSRTACPTNSSTSTTTSAAISSCVGDVDFYACVDGTCDVVGNGYFSVVIGRWWVNIPNYYS
jgi:hypothetical protein